MSRGLLEEQTKELLVLVQEYLVKVEPTVSDYQSIVDRLRAIDHYAEELIIEYLHCS